MIKDIGATVCNIVKQKADKLKLFSVQGVQIQEEELVHLVRDIEEYKKSMEIGEREMRESMSAFMAALGTTLEVLGEAGKIKYKQRFCRKGVQRCNVHIFYHAISTAKLWTSISLIAIGQYLSIL